MAPLTFGSGVGAATAVGLPSQKDVPIDPANGPTDSVTKLEFNPVADFLAVGSWDNQVRIYEYQASTGQTAPKAAVSHDGPALNLSWSKDGTKLLTSSSDHKAKMLDLNQPGAQPQQIAQHDAPISCINWVEVNGQGVVVTAGWDKVVKYWDTRTPNPVATITAPERVYAMGTMDTLLVYGTADRHVMIVDLKNPQTPKSTKESPLKMQTRVITCFPAHSANVGPGYAIGSVEGRVAIQYAEEKDSTNNFSFKCHRGEAPPSSVQGQNRTAAAASANQQEVPVYSVNAISFNKLHGTFSTAGSDGSLSFWDKDQRTRLKTYKPEELGNGNAAQKIPPTPIVATGFSRNSDLFAYAYSYDWSKGHMGAIPQMQTKVMIHAVAPEEIKPKKK